MVIHLQSTETYLIFILRHFIPSLILEFIFDSAALRTNLYSKDWASFCFKVEIVCCGYIFVLMPLVSFGFCTRGGKFALPIYVYGFFKMAMLLLIVYIGSGIIVYEIYN